MRTPSRRTVPVLAALLLLAAPALAGVHAAPPAPTVDATCGAACPMMMAAARGGAAVAGSSCHRPGVSGVSCCETPDDPPALPLDGAVPASGSGLDAPLAATAGLSPRPAPFSAARGAAARPSPPPGPELFLLHASFLS